MVLPAGGEELAGSAEPALRPDPSNWRNHGCWSSCSIVSRLSGSLRRSICTNVLALSEDVQYLPMYVCMHACIYACMYACIWCYVLALSEDVQYLPNEGS